MAALAAVVLPLVGLVATPGAARADVAPVPAPAPAPELTWKVSDWFVDHFTPKVYAPGSSLVAGHGASLNANNVTTFPSASGWADQATGAASIRYDGSVTGTFVAGGATQYSLTLANPEVTVTGGKGQIRADVDWTVPSASPSTGAADDVLLTTFDATAGDWSGRTVSATPHWAGVLPADSPTASALGIPAGQPVDGKAWSPEFLAVLDPGLRGHFYASGKSSDTKKPPSMITATAADPTAVVSTTSADTAGLGLHVDGAGYAPTGTGVYVGLTEAGPINPADAGGYLGTVWVRDSQIAPDGTFSVDLDKIAPSQLDRAKAYEVHTLKAHGVPDRSQDVRAPVSIDFSRFERVRVPVTANPVTTVYGKGAAIVARVPGAAGQVAVRIGPWKATRTLVAGRSTIPIPRTLKGGSHSATITYSGSAANLPAVTTTRVAIKKAATATVARVTKTPKRKRTGVAIVRVTNASRTGIAPTGKVRVVMRKGKQSVVRSAWLRKGSARIVLPKRAKGVWRTTFTYRDRGTNFNGSTKSVKIRVRH